MTAKITSTDDSARITGKARVVLAIDVGGSHIKARLSSGGEKRAVASGPDTTARKMVELVSKMTADWDYDVISIGFPGPVEKQRPAADPFNLGKGWKDFDFGKAFGKPVKIVNDAMLQAIGAYDGGRILFLGLGTGLGSAMIVENVCVPMELGHLPYKKNATFEDYLGERGARKRGKSKWRKSVFRVVAKLQAGLLPHYIVIGGGNVEKLKRLPPNCRRGDNENAFPGGFRLWQDENIRI
jgi:polyphosphate glucokinase